MKKVLISLLILVMCASVILGCAAPATHETPTTPTTATPKPVTTTSPATQTPTKSELHYNQGASFANQGKYDDAITEFNQAIELDPGYTRAYEYRGFAYYHKGQLDLAIADYTKVIEFDPGYALAYNNRGIIYAELGQRELAIQDLKKAIELSTDANLTQSSQEKLASLMYQPSALSYKGEIQISASTGADTGSEYTFNWSVYATIPFEITLKEDPEDNKLFEGFVTVPIGWGGVWNYYGQRTSIEKSLSGIITGSGSLGIVASWSTSNGPGKEFWLRPQTQDFLSHTVSLGPTAAELSSTLQIGAPGHFTNALMMALDDAKLGEVQPTGRKFTFSASGNQLDPATRQFLTANGQWSVSVVVSPVDLK